LVALEGLSQYEWQVQPVWLAVAGAFYIAGLVPMAWFWHRTLAALGQPAPWSATLRAYFLGHMGKYVPGKAMAVILRIAAVRKWVPNMRIAIISTMLETLTMMAVGAFLAAAFSAFFLRTRPDLAALALIVALAVVAPTLPPVVRRFALLNIGISKPSTADVDEVRQCELNDPAMDWKSKLSGVNYRLLLQGWFAALVCWMLLGLSLWATLRAVGVEELSPTSDLPRLVAAVAFAVVLGFASMLPGGIGVRDGVLVSLLAESCGPANALVATVLLRLIWLVSEFAVCVIIYTAAKWHGFLSVRPPHND
jgi:uncharacterized membrane protein YbhN (UPF0104 family)